MERSRTLTALAASTAWLSFCAMWLVTSVAFVSTTASPLYRPQGPSQQRYAAFPEFAGPYDLAPPSDDEPSNLVAESVSVEVVPLRPITTRFVESSLCAILKSLSRIPRASRPPPSA